MSRFAVTIVPVTPLQQNCAILVDTAAKACVVVDPGGDVEQIIQALDEVAKAHEARPSAIWLTHGHIDHAAGADELREKIQVPIVGPHKDDAFLLENLTVQAPMFGIAEARNVVPDQWLEEGSNVQVGELTFDVHHCPGHAPGHVIFVARDLPFAVLGDVLFDGSVGRTDFPYANTEQLMTSIKTHVLPLNDDVTFICGHGPASTIGRQRAANPFLQGL